MPVNNKWNVDELLKACRIYANTTSRRISFEYALMKGVNDTPECAKELAYYLSDLNCNINLIVYNPVMGDKYKRPKKDDIHKFKFLLEAAGKKVTIRLERGLDIDAACGQLRAKNERR